MQSLSEENKDIKYLSCAIDVFSKYAIVVPLKDRKGSSIVNAFNKIIKQSIRKPNKIWVDQGSEFYNRVFKKCLSSNDKHRTATGKNVYYDLLDDAVNEYNNTKHSTIKMKPKDIKNDTTKSSVIARNNRIYIDEYNKKRARFNVGDRVRISKFKNIFAKGYTPNWSREILIVDKINDTVPYTYNLKDLNDEEIIGSFYDRELQKTKL